MEILFRQLFDPESSTYTYLLADTETREALLIDSVLEQVTRDMGLISDLGLHLQMTIDTHAHADHITGAGALRERLKSKAAISAKAGVRGADVYIQDGDILRIGAVELTALATPGHTDGCMSFFGHGRVFTGDALLIRGTGRTDFQNGSAEALFDSIQRLYKLPAETIVYPGHDYKGFTVSTIGEERRLNPRIQEGTPLGTFKETMANLKLSPPKKIHLALPANLECGRSLPR